MAKRGRHHRENKKFSRIWGNHAVGAALDNPQRVLKKIWGTREAIAKLGHEISTPIEYTQSHDLHRLVPVAMVHQNIVADFVPLSSADLTDILNANKENNRPIIILDQVTDPHNVGAIMRSAAAFNACALVTQDRHSPPESGIIAKAASGALEIVPWVRTVNLARALEHMADYHYWRIGLDGNASHNLSTMMTHPKIALVMGAEGKGLRENIAKHCDLLSKLSMSPQMESLNVSNAAAIALYEIYTAAQTPEKPA